MDRQMKVRRRLIRRAGFTLIEVMIVIAILLALASLVGVALFQQREAATDDLVRIDLKSIESAMEYFRLDYQRWPTDDEGIEVLWNKEILDPDADQNKWKKYLKKGLPRDRYGHDWVYSAEGENHGEESDMYDLFSIGRDGEEGTEDDITNWEGEGEDDGFGGFDEPIGTGG
jgi:general secretion pathway protein G